MRRDPVEAAVALWLDLYAPSGPVTVACSGGADSLALAVGIAALGRAGLAVTVDHQVQPDSAAQAERTVNTLTGLGFRAVAVAVEVGSAGGPEAAARQARYGALAEYADGPVLLAHTLDDQAETVLLGLARGSGPRSIAGMLPVSGEGLSGPVADGRDGPVWGRPLLSVRRTDTLAACQAAGLVPWEDPQNSDPAFTRVRLRTEVLPLLEDVLGGGVAPALARTAELMADDLAALDGLAAAAGPPGDLLTFSTRPTALRRRALRSWASANGALPLTADHLTRLDALCAGAGRGSAAGAAVRLPGGFDAVISRGRIRLIKVARDPGGVGREVQAAEPDGRLGVGGFTVPTDLSDHLHSPGAL